MNKAIIFFLLCYSLTAHGANPSAAGLWVTYDDHDGLPTSLVRIEEVAGNYEATIVKILPRPGVDKNALCDKCDGVRKNQPVTGMTIMWGMKRRDNEYVGGEILDPEDGNIYRCKLRLAGDQLEVRGFLGITLFGRTQIWIRESPIIKSP